MNDIIGYFGAIIIGLILGLTGGGGSILTVPILVYILYINPIIATAYSLFIVGTTSGIGAIQNYRKGFVVIKTGLLYAIPSFIAVFITRKFIVSNIPEIIYSNSSFQINKGNFLMILFAIVMFFAALSMLKRQKNNDTSEVAENNLLKIIIQNFSIGVVTGLIGAGGGFLIIPALVHFAKLPMKKAIGTSLMIISINSLIGFIGDVQNSIIDWSFLFKFSSLSILGICIGIYLHKFTNETLLKKFFGWFVLAMSLFIISKELFS